MDINDLTIKGYAGVGQAIGSGDINVAESEDGSSTAGKTLLAAFALTPPGLVYATTIAGAAIAGSVMGCDGEEKKPEVVDAGPPPPTCDSYNMAKPTEYKDMDEESFNSLRHIYGNDDFNRTTAYNWADDVQELLGATEPLYKAACNKSSKKTDKYLELVGERFSEHYDRVTNDKLNGALVLLNIISPGGKDNKDIVFDGVEDMEDNASDQKSFANVLRAAHHFNTALEAYYGPMLEKLEGKEDEFAKLLKEMFKEPTVSCVKLGKAKGTVVDNLKEVEEYLKKVDEDDFEPKKGDDDKTKAIKKKQKELYEALKAALKTFKVKCGGGRRPPPPPPPPPGTGFHRPNPYKSK